MSDYISDISTYRGASGNGSTARASGSKNTLDMTDFLQLMVAQFQNQDPENAASTSDMLNQLVQMSVVQAVSTITDATTMLYSASLVGKEVTIGQYKDNKLQEIVGTVTGTGVYGGQNVIFVDGERYNLSSIMAVGRIPEKPSEPEGNELDGSEPGADGTDGA